MSIATDGKTAIELVRRLMGLDALNLLHRDDIPKLMRVLRQRLPGGLIA